MVLDDDGWWGLVVDSTSNLNSVHSWVSSTDLPFRSIFLASELELDLEEM